MNTAIQLIISALHPTEHNVYILELNPFLYLNFNVDDNIDLLHEDVVLSKIANNVMHYNALYAFSYLGYRWIDKNLVLHYHMQMDMTQSLKKDIKWVKIDKNIVDKLGSNITNKVTSLTC